MNLADIWNTKSIFNHHSYFQKNRARCLIKSIVLCFLFKSLYVTLIRIPESRPFDVKRLIFLCICTKIWFFRGTIILPPMQKALWEPDRQSVCSQRALYMLVAVAAILGHEPVLAQPLRFVHRLADAVEELAMQRTVGIPDLRHSVRIPKFRVAFLAGHQIKLFHLCIRPFVFRVSGTQRYHCIMNGRFLPLTLVPKRLTDFQRECVLTRSAPCGAIPGCAALL